MSTPRMLDVMDSVSAMFEQLLAGTFAGADGYVSLSVAWRSDEGRLLTFSIKQRATGGDEPVDDLVDEDEQ